MRVALYLAATVAAVVVSVAAAFVLLGPERVWRLVGGDPDLGPVSFEALERSRHGNDFLVCPEATCARARPELISPVYGLAAPELLAAADRLVVEIMDAERVDGGENPLAARYVVRTRRMRFPDTLHLEAVPAEGIVQRASNDGGEEAPPKTLATLIVYSRSKLGRRDFGANAARVRLILRALAERVPVVRPAAEATAATGVASRQQEAPNRP